MNVIFSRRAAADLDRLRGFLAERDPPSSARAMSTLMDSIRLLESFPGMGRPLGRSGMREIFVPFGQSAYVVRYFQSAARDAVVIQRIWHGREMRG